MLKTINVFKWICIFTIGCLFFYSCRGKDNQDVISKIDINYSEIDIDTIILEPRAFSGTGFFRVNNNQISFFDDVFMTVSNFNMKGDFINWKLGKGDREKEISRISYEGYDEKLGHVIFGSNYYFNRFNDDWGKISGPYILNWKNRKTAGTSNLSDISAYDFNHENSFFDSKWLNIDKNGNIIAPILMTGHGNPTYNWFSNPDVFYKDALTVGVFDAKTGRLKQGFAKHPEIFQEQKYLHLFDYNYIALKDDSLLIGFKPDSLIYVYDSKYDLRYAFGQSGKGMNTNYPSVKTIGDIEREVHLGLDRFGIYHHLFYDKKSQLIFRSYSKGNSDESGLQIYKNQTLIADVIVPKRFNVIGRIGDIFYADGLIDEDKGLLGIYRFKL